MLDLPIPAVMTVAEAAVVLRSRDCEKNRAFVRKLLGEGRLRQAKRIKGQRSTIYITALSVREYAKSLPYQR